MSEIQEHFAVLNDCLDKMKNEIETIGQDSHFEKNPPLFVKIFDIDKAVRDAQEALNEHIEF